MTPQTWQIDSAHSGIHFSVRHLVIAKVRGQFSRWTGALTVPDGDFGRASVDGRRSTPRRSKPASPTATPT